MRLAVRPPPKFITEGPEKDKALRIAPQHSRRSPCAGPDSALEEVETQALTAGR